MEFTEKKLVELLAVSQPALFKALKNIHFELKVVEGSTKPVKHYLYNDLPQRYKDKLVELGVVKEDKKDDSKRKEEYEVKKSHNANIDKLIAAKEAEALSNLSIEDLKALRK